MKNYTLWVINSRDEFDRNNAGLDNIREAACDFEDSDKLDDLMRIMVGMNNKKQCSDTYYFYVSCNLTSTIIYS